MSKNKSSKNNKFFKKIGRGLFTFFEKLYKIIDRFIVVPITKFMLFVIRPFQTNNKPFERLLNNKAFLLTLSLALAFLAFFVVDGMSDAIINNSAETLYGQKVTALYNEEAYVIEGLPETVDITMIGRKADLYLAKQYPTEDVVVDLRDLKPGTHRVSIKYNGSVSSVSYRLDPTSTTVVIYEKVSESKTIEREILNSDKLNTKYTIKNITLSRDDVYIKGAQYKLDEVATVKALVNIEDLVNPVVGANTLKDVKLVAYDANGDKLEGVEIVPSTVDATIEIASPSKEVTLEVVPSGDVVFGRAIESITLSATRATIYGDEQALAAVTSIPIKIDVSNLDSSKEFNVNVDKPTGITEISVPTVTVRVTLSEINEKTVDGVNIETRNIGNNLVAQAGSQADTSVSVIVKGTSGNINAANRDNITAYVDLTGLDVGTHVVPVQVEGSDVKLSYTPKTTTVTIVITRR